MSLFYPLHKPLSPPVPPSTSIMAEEDEQGSTEDVRLLAIKQFCLKTMKQKSDKWAKMMSQEDNSIMLTEFLEKADKRVLVIHLLSSGQLSPIDTFPTTNRNKAVYFIKRTADALRKDNFKEVLLFGDMSHVPLDQLSSVVESVSVYVSMPCYTTDWLQGVQKIQWSKITALINCSTLH